MKKKKQEIKLKLLWFLCLHTYLFIIHLCTLKDV